MTTWDPTIYSAFAQPRLRPALDMIGRIGAEGPQTVVDLGCGTGNVTRILAQRWPGARVTGVDSSAEMLAAAAKESQAVRWVQGDMAAWRAEAKVDLLFSNAALHWLGDHETLFPRLAAQVAPGGWLAVQMPHNHYAASHRVMAEAGEAGPWADTLRPLTGKFPVGEPSLYYRLLAPLADSLDIWETEYMHVLDGDNPVVQWTMGTALRPLLDALVEPWRGDYLAEYARRIRAEYPPQADGKTLFPFRRLFMVAKIK